ncbi:MAG TPA: pentapeptide repeat-containing protein [Terracidiphilus sp.]|nr:pentapeptide repeat-containing protein [Terracidiphilus sp.]
MILHRPIERPAPWKVRKQEASAKWKWLTPLIAVEWMCEWAAYILSNWSFLEVLEYLGTFSVLIAVIFYFSESGDRIKQRHYQAWQVINTAQGKGGSGGRIDALQELNADKVPLVGVDVSSAFLQGLDLHGANLMRSNFSSADLRNANFTSVDFTFASLNSANLRNAHLDHAKFTQADLRGSDLTGSILMSADLSGATLDDADLSDADLSNIGWQHLSSVKGANIHQVKNAPEGFVVWAMSHGAIDNPTAEQ